MDVVIKSRNLEVNERLKEHIEKKVSKLDRFLPNIGEARVELRLQQTKSLEDRHVVQLTLISNSTILRAEERSSDLYNSLDAVLDKMTRQIERYKGKHWRSQVRSQPSIGEEFAPAPEPELDSEVGVARVKRFETRPMGVEEAIEQMELLGHDFFLFYNMATSSYSVVYKRHDGGYGLLLPEVI